MLADTMMPEAYEHGGKLVGVDRARRDLEGVPGRQLAALAGF